jgi:hypothetical protein
MGDEGRLGKGACGDLKAEENRVENEPGGCIIISCYVHPRMKK